MASNWLATYKRHQRTIEWSFLFACLALFAYCFADWRGWLPFERGFRPLRNVHLSGGFLTYSVATLIRPRSVGLFSALSIVSVALLVRGLFVAS